MTMTLLGLLADIAYFQMCVGVMLAGDGQWVPALAWYLEGVGVVVLLTTVGWRRARAMLAQAEQEEGR
ncbi:hypothetical protein [Nonomuraea sp. NPDC049750]|uniref:hypothetical protein n=1 Tax=Nonomuraea sp. NPDC049750 TaxID=3154738 RepID=UPI0033CC0D6C